MSYDPTHSEPVQAEVIGHAPARPGVFGLRAAIWLMLLMMLIVVLPYLAQQIEYGITRGRQQAESDAARAQLAGLPETTSIYRVVAKAVEPSVVGVVTTQEVRTRRVDEWSDLFGGQRRLRSEALGSGVIVDPAGYLITNAHVVAKASEIVVELSDGRTIKNARLVGEDPLTDVAVLKINAAGLTAAPWGDSDKLEVGDPVLAIGNPYGLARTVTAGIVSAKERRGLLAHTVYQDFLQTDAAVNPGNSGGPLVNMQGQVVGINTAIVGESYQGISFAIPSKVAQDVYERLKGTGKVVRGWLGVSLQPLDERLSKQLGIKDQHGALVTGVVSGGPGEEAGIEAGDVILEFNGQRVRDTDDLILGVARAEIGSKAKLGLTRNGQRSEVTVTIGERPQQVR